MGPLRGFLEGLGRFLAAEHHPARVEGRHLADGGLDARIARRDVDDMAARIAAPPQTDAIAIALRLAINPVDGVRQIGGLIDRVDHLANFLHLGRESSIAGTGWLRAGKNHARVTGSPAAIVERHHQEAGPGKLYRVAAQHRRHAPPAVRHDDRRQLFRGGVLRSEDFGGHARAFAHDRRRAKRHVVRRRERTGPVLTGSG